MPVSVKIDPFSKQQKEEKAPAPPKSRAKPKGPVSKESVPGVREVHLKVLRVMMPKYPDDPPFEWPLFNRTFLRVVCGLSPTNSMNRILHGVKDGPGRHLGLLGLGLIEEVVLDVESVAENNYRITHKGIEICQSLQSGAAPK